jgi:purine-binding chemotaxis protein CheW
MDVLLFTIDARRIAIPLRQVMEVLLAVNVMNLYDAPNIIEGVVNVRGAVLPVLALRARMGHPPRDVRASDYFIIVRTSTRDVILVSDTTPEIVALESAPEEDTRNLQRAHGGVLPLADGLALFQDLDAFMAAGDDDEQREVLAGAALSA